MQDTSSSEGSDDDLFDDLFYVAICKVCGYQWDEDASSLEHLRCAICSSGEIAVYSNMKKKIQGEDYDGRPWL